MALTEIDDDSFDVVAKKSDKKSEKLQGCFINGTTVTAASIARLFTIFFSVLADLGREAMEAFVHANALTYRVPFAAIMGSDKYADTATGPFKVRQNAKEADEAFTAYFLKADFGSTEANWESLAAGNCARIEIDPARPPACAFLLVSLISKEWCSTPSSPSLTLLCCKHSRKLQCGTILSPQLRSAHSGRRFSPSPTFPAAIWKSF
jgi:hypothetical protein